jgi:molecular chaperone HscA
LQIANKKISAIELASHILFYCKQIAEQYLACEVQKAVITVPAYFDEAAKNATKQAAELAGLQVIRLLNEPTSAAFAYGLQQNYHGTFAVYDLGGGTFDVSVLRLNKQVFQVLGVSGDNNLGGDDIDFMMVQNGFANNILQAKNIKEMLSSNDSVANVNRQQFNALIEPLVAKTMHIFNNLLSELGLSYGDLDGLMLVGGSSYIPAIKQLFANFLPQQKILSHINGQYVVAMGAGLQAHNLTNSKNNLLLDVNPLSLGIETMGGIVDKIILRNSAIPVAKSKDFTTYANNQTAIKLHIVQGEREFAQDCRSLAYFEVKNLPPLPAGAIRLSITFALDADGLLTVKAFEHLTKQQLQVVVNACYALPPDEIKNLLLASLQYAKQDMHNRLLAETKVAAQKDIDIISSDIEHIDVDNKNDIIKHLAILKDLLANNADREAILLAQQNLASCSEQLILNKMSKALKTKLNNTAI